MSSKSSGILKCSVKLFNPFRSNMSPGRTVMSFYYGDIINNSLISRITSHALNFLYVQNIRTYFHIYPWNNGETYTLISNYKETRIP